MAKLKDVPQPLLRQLMLRLGAAVMSLFFCVCSFLLYGEPYLSLSLLAVSIAIGVSGLWFYNTVVTQQYIVVEGSCQKVEQTPILRKNKAVYVFAAPHTIKVTPHQRNANVQIGDTLRLYVAARTPVYHADGYEVLSGYMAMEVLKGAVK